MATHGRAERHAPVPHPGLSSATDSITTSSLPVTLVLLVAAALARGNTTQEGRDSYQDDLMAETRLIMVNQSTESMDDILQDAMRLQRENNNGLRESLKIQNQINNFLEEFLELPKMLSDIREQVRQQKETSSFLEKKLADCYHVPIFAEENEDLKYRLGREVKKVNDLERKLKESLRRTEELTAELKHLNETTSQDRGEKTIEELCQVAEEKNFRKQVQEFEKTKDWEALRTSLEDVMGHDRQHRLQATPEHQVQHRQPLVLGRHHSKQAAAADAGNLRRGCQSHRHREKQCLSRGGEQRRCGAGRVARGPGGGRRVVYPRRPDAAHFRGRLGPHKHGEVPGAAGGERRADGPRLREVIWSEGHTGVPVQSAALAPGDLHRSFPPVPSLA